MRRPKIGRRVKVWYRDHMSVDIHPAEVHGYQPDVRDDEGVVLRWDMRRGAVDYRNGERPVCILQHGSEGVGGKLCCEIILLGEVTAWEYLD